MTHKCTTCNLIASLTY